MGIDYVTVIIHGFVGLVFFFAVFAVFLVVVAAPTEAVLARLRSRRRATYLGVVNSGKGDMSFPAPTAADREWFFVSLAPPLWVSYIFFQFTMVDQYTGTSYTSFASWEPYATLAVVWLVWLFAWRSFAQACKRRPARYRRSLASAILIGLIGMLLMTDMLGDTMGSFLFSNQYLPGYFTSAFATISVRSDCVEVLPTNPQSSLKLPPLPRYAVYVGQANGVQVLLDVKSTYSISVPEGLVILRTVPPYPCERAA